MQGLEGKWVPKTPLLHNRALAIVEKGTGDEDVLAISTKVKCTR